MIFRTDIDSKAHAEWKVILFFVRRLVRWLATRMQAHSQKTLRLLSGILPSHTHKKHKQTQRTWGTVAQLTSDRAPCLRRSSSSRGGADELKMGCLVSSSLQREFSIRVIRGSAAWHEGTQIILGMFSPGKSTAVLNCIDILFFFFLLLFALKCLWICLTFNFFFLFFSFGPFLQLRSVTTTLGSILKVTAPNSSFSRNTRRSWSAGLRTYTRQSWCKSCEKNTKKTISASVVLTYLHSLRLNKQLTFM